MTILSTIVNTINSLGGAIVLPIIFIILGLLFGLKADKAVHAGLYVGIGFKGIQLIISYLTEVLSPAQEYFISLGSGFTITDMPWTAVGALQYSAPWTIIGIPAMVIISVILVRAKIVKTLDVDIWSYGEFFLLGSVAWIVFDSYLVGILVTFGLFFVTQFLADHFSPRVSESLGMKNVTISNSLWLITGGSVCWVVNKILDLIPGVKNININADNMKTKLGIFGETCVIGAILGFILGIISKQDFSGVITMTIGLSASMVLLPHVLKVFMEGIAIVTGASTKWANKKLGEGREINFAVDIALTAGTPCAITIGTILIPFTLLFAIVVPNFPYFPIGFMTVVIYLAGWCSMYCKQNFFRALICALCLVITCMLIACYVAPEATSLMVALGETSGDVTSVVFASWPNFLLSLVKHIIG